MRPIESLSMHYINTLYRHTLSTRTISIHPINTLYQRLVFVHTPSQEVYSQDKPRLSISGWFHGPDPPKGSDMASLKQIMVTDLSTLEYTHQHTLSMHPTVLGDPIIKP